MYLNLTLGRQESTQYRLVIVHKQLGGSNLRKMVSATWHARGFMTTSRRLFTDSYFAQHAC